MDERAYQYEIAGLKARIERDYCVQQWHGFLHLCAALSLVFILLYCFYFKCKYDSFAKRCDEIVNSLEYQRDTIQHNIDQRFEKLLHPEPQEQ